MERIKKALEQAREQREQLSVAEAELLSTDINEKFSAGVQARIKTASPIDQLAPDRAAIVMRLGELRGYQVGETIFEQNAQDEYVHYLVAGRVSLSADGKNLHSIDGEQDIAKFALDESGTKPCTVRAEAVTKVFRVPYTVLRRQLELHERASGKDTDGDAEKTDNTIERLRESLGRRPVASEQYAQTMSGQQLASLVDAIHDENSSLKGAVETATDLEEISGNIRLDEGFFKLDLQTLIKPDEANEVEKRPRVAPADTDDEITRLVHNLEERVRKHVDASRQEERRRIQALLDSSRQRLRAQLQTQVRDAITKARVQDQKKYQQREQRLRERYEQLARLANRITHQKAAVMKARQQLDEKLKAADLVHQELRDLGHTMYKEIDGLEEIVAQDESQARSSKGR